jgi:hypothetical protein
VRPRSAGRVVQIVVQARLFCLPSRTTSVTPAVEPRGRCSPVRQTRRVPSAHGPARRDDGAHRLRPGRYGVNAAVDLRRDHRLVTILLHSQAAKRVIEGDSAPSQALELADLLDGAADQVNQPGRFDDDVQTSEASPRATPDGSFTPSGRLSDPGSTTSTDRCTWVRNSRRRTRVSSRASSARELTSCSNPPGGGRMRAGECPGRSSAPDPQGVDRRSEREPDAAQNGRPILRAWIILNKARHYGAA